MYKSALSEEARYLKLRAKNADSLDQDGRGKRRPLTSSMGISDFNVVKIFTCTYVKFANAQSRNA